MDRTEKPKNPTRFANHGEVIDADDAALLSSTGRETSTEVPDVSITHNRCSEVTGRHNRQRCERDCRWIDLIGGRQSGAALRTLLSVRWKGTLRILPVFDRADALPKI